MKKWILVLAAVLVLAGLGGWVFFRRPATPAPAPTAAQAEVKPVDVVEAATGAEESAMEIVVSEIQGSATIERGDKKMVARPRMALQPGDVLTVSQNGTLAFIWRGYGRTLLGGGSRLVLSDASQVADQGMVRVWMELEAGKVWTRLEKLLGTGSSFSVQSSDTVSTVRGTSFGLERIGKRVKVKVMESKVAVAKMKQKDKKQKMSPDEIDALWETAMEVSEGDWMEATDDQEAMSKPKKMDDGTKRDRFTEAGNKKVSEKELQMEAGTMDVPDAPLKAPIKELDPDQSSISDPEPVDMSQESLDDAAPEEPPLLP